MGCLCSRELAAEHRLADEIEAAEILRQVEQKSMSDNVMHFSSLEYILVKISGRNRVRFYNSLDQSVYLWIYEDVDHLRFTKQTFDARLNLPVVNLELGGSAKRERPPYSDPPIQAMMIASGVTIPVYTYHPTLYLTFGVFENTEGGELDLRILQHRRLIPTNSRFTFRNYHLAKPISYLPHLPSKHESEYYRHVYVFNPVWEHEYAYSDRSNTRG